VNRSSSLGRFFRSHISCITIVFLIVLAWSIPAFCGEIHDAAKNGDLSKVEALLKDDSELVFTRDRLGRTPLHWAAQEGHKDVVRVLLASKANVNAKVNQSERTILVENGLTPLHLAVMAGKKDVAELLLANKADASAKDDVGRTPLHIAASSGSKTLIELLLANNADVNATENWMPVRSVGYPPIPTHIVSKSSGTGWTPLHEAAARNHKDVVQVLLANGADLNVRDSEYGDTPLHWAAENGNRDVVELLLNKGADVNNRDNLGETPLHVAALNGYKSVAELLLAHGADVNARDLAGCTPSCLAAQRGFKDVEELLRQHGGHE
jgi:ankyrin repeat protein